MSDANVPHVLFRFKAGDPEERENADDERDFGTHYDRLINILTVIPKSGSTGHDHRTEIDRKFSECQRLLKRMLQRFTYCHHLRPNPRNPQYSSTAIRALYAVVSKFYLLVALLSAKNIPYETDLPKEGFSEYKSGTLWKTYGIDKMNLFSIPTVDIRVI